MIFRSRMQRLPLRYAVKTWPGSPAIFFTRLYLNHDVSSDCACPCCQEQRSDTGYEKAGTHHFVHHHSGKRLLPRFENPGPRFFHRYFLVNPSQKTGFRNIHYQGRIRIKDPQVSMRLIFKRAADIKEMFDLIAHDRDRIEEEVGFRLQWLRDRGLKESHIVTGPIMGSPIVVKPITAPIALQNTASALTGAHRASQRIGPTPYVVSSASLPDGCDTDYLCHGLHREPSFGGDGGSRSCFFDPVACSSSLSAGSRLVAC